jgi:hypothetical protein
MNSPILAPVVALVIWSMVMWVWMYATRIPAIFALKMRLDPKATRGEQMNQLPPQVRWKADNYNHLMEQPTIFYAIVLVLALSNGSGGQTCLILAWSYVVLRVLHSLIQAHFNIIELRFAFYILSNIPLIGLIFFAAKAVI